MTKALVYLCNCQGPHGHGCQLLRRLTIKEQVCQERGVLSFIPEDVAEEIDRRVAADTW